MRVALIALLLLLAGCAEAEIELETYELGDIVKMATHCAVADPIVASVEGDGLPSIADTQTDRVNRVLAETRAELLEAYDGIDARVVARNGQVLSGPAGAATVRDVEDSLILVEITGNALCPTAPTFWNGIPLAFFREGYLG